MVELRPGRASVMNVLATPDACDGLLKAGVVGADVCRVAPDELLVIALHERAAVTVERVSANVDDPDALVLDVTDGWSAWVLEGPGARDAFTRLSELRLPDRGFEQGAVANMPVKILVGADHITVLVPSMLGEAFRERVDHDACRAGVGEAT